MIEVDGPFGVNLTYAYDANGNQVLVQDSAGGSMASSYNDAGQLVDRWFSEDGHPLLGLAQGYDANGNLVAQTGYAGDGSVVATTTYAYDAAGNLVLLTHTAADGTIIAAYAYTYDTGGNLVAENDTGTQQSYGYDGAGELTDDNGNQQTFDANGNRTNPGYVTGLDNQLLSDGTWNYTYDKEGNLAGKTNIATGETWTYGYDNLNEMTSAVHRNASGALLLQVRYGYDVFGHRVEEDVYDPTGVQSSVTKFVYNGDQIWATLDASNQVTERYVSLDGLDSAFARIGAAGGVGWLLADRLGSVRDIVNNSGQVIDHIDYDAWGSKINETQPANGDAVGYAGYWFDAAVGLDQDWHREYDPASGRFTQKDPTGFVAGDSDLYRYVANDPTNANDPTGEAEWEIDNTNRTITMIVRVSFDFIDAPSEITKDRINWINSSKQGIVDSWTTARKEAFGKKAAERIEKAWNDGDYLLRSEQSVTYKEIGTKLERNLMDEKVVPVLRKQYLDWTPKLKVIIVDSKADYHVQVLANSDKIQLTSASVIGGNGANGVDGWWDEDDVGPNTTDTKARGQNTIAHEFGHLLGLNHPGGSSNDQSAYAADATALMGWGNQMRAIYYQLWQKQLQAEMKWRSVTIIGN